MLARRLRTGDRLGIVVFVTDPAAAALICAQGGATANACLPFLPWELLSALPGWRSA